MSPAARRKEEKPRGSASGILTTERLRILILGGIVAFVFLAMLVRLAYVQIQSADRSITAISNQSIRRIRIPARRGKIYTRDLKLLAGSSSDLNLVFYPQEMRVKGNRKQTIDHIYETAETVSRAIGKPNPLSKEDIARHLNYQPGLPLVVFRQLTPRELERAFPEEPGHRRNRRGTRRIAHLSGRRSGRPSDRYTRPAHPDNPLEASDRKQYSYYVPDRIGVEGIERAFDRLPGTSQEETDYDPKPGTPETPLGLRGMPGYSLVQVDHLGMIRRNIISRIEPHHGNNVILAIDSRAQKIAESIISGQRAALVVLDASNGDVIASASSPTYNLSAGFSTIIRKDYYDKLLKSPGRPLYNRAFLGNYTPGSILKPLVALAFLNSGVSPEEIVNCDGETIVNGVRIRCAARAGHGPLNLRGALAKSCNDYMIEHATAIGLVPIADVLRSAESAARPAWSFRRSPEHSPATPARSAATATPSAGTVTIRACCRSARESSP